MGTQLYALHADQSDGVAAVVRARSLVALRICRCPTQPRESSRPVPSTATTRCSPRDPLLPAPAVSCMASGAVLRLFQLFGPSFNVTCWQPEMPKCHEKRSVEYFY
eukprot:scaffold376157_cov27-Prasinocladus_malaysianus.AAC.1